MNVSERILASMPIGQEFWLISIDHVDNVDDLSEVFTITKGILVNVKVDMDETIEGETLKGSTPKAKFQMCHLKEFDGELKKVYCWTDDLYDSRESAEQAYIKLLTDMAIRNGITTPEVKGVSV